MVCRSSIQKGCEVSIYNDGEYGRRVLHVDDEPEDSGMYVLYISDEVDTYDKCGRISADHVKAVREILSRQ